MIMITATPLPTPMTIRYLQLLYMPKILDQTLFQYYLSVLCDAQSFISQQINSSDNDTDFLPILFATNDTRLQVLKRASPAIYHYQHVQLFNFHRH